MRLHLLTVAIVLVNLSSLAQATTITGSYGAPAGNPIDLTSGTNGWVRISGLDTQASGGTGLSLFSHVGFVGTSETEGNPYTFIPAGTGGNDGSRYPVIANGGLQPNGTGYAITVSASPLAQTLQVYVSAYIAGLNPAAGVLLAGDFAGVNGGGLGVWTINIPAGYGPLTASYILSGNTSTVEFSDYTNLSVFGATVTAVPEPGSLALLLFGGLTMFLFRSTKRTV